VQKNLINTWIVLRLRLIGHLKCISPPPKGAAPLLRIVNITSLSPDRNFFNIGIAAAWILSTDGSCNNNTQIILPTLNSI